MHRSWKVAFVAAGTIMMGATASATSMTKMDFTDMVSEASACVIADVVNVTSAKRDGQVVTLTTFRVEKAAFGDTGGQITVVTPGGESTIGRLQVSEVVPGAPRFLNDQSTVMLLSDAGLPGEYSIIGLNQGLFNVSQGANGVDQVVLPIGDGTKLSVDEAVEIILDERGNPIDGEVE